MNAGDDVNASAKTGKGVERGVGAHQREVVEQSLGGKRAIEGVPVIPPEAARSQGVAMGDGGGVDAEPVADLVEAADEGSGVGEPPR